MTESERPAPEARALQRQTTLKNAIHCSGTALHHGGHVSMAMLPAPANSGIVFRRTDLAGRGVSIPANWRHVADMPMCTALEDQGVQIATVEHLMAALSGCAIVRAQVSSKDGWNNASAIISYSRPLVR